MLETDVKNSGIRYQHEGDGHADEHYHLRPRRHSLFTRLDAESFFKTILKHIERFHDQVF